MSRWYYRWFHLALWFVFSFLWLQQVSSVSSGQGWSQLLVIWVCCLALSIFTHRSGYRPHGLLLACFLLSLGWLMQYRLSPEWASNQFRGILLGFAAYIVGLYIDWSHGRYQYIFGVGALLLLLGTLLFGVEIGGAKAWLAVGPIRFQPVEFARVLLVLFLVRYLVHNRELLRPGLGQQWPNLRYWGPLVVLMSGVFLLLAVQRDLGPALLVFFVSVALSLAIVFSWKLVLVYASLAISGVVIACGLFPHFRNRIRAWIMPWDYIDTSGYQVIQGLFALNAGGFFGTGIGFGMGEVIPEVHTDYIFALIGEELGLLGTTAVLIVYVSLTFWGMKTISMAKDALPQYTGLGIILLWTFQVFLVVGGILRLVPLTGMTLPFISYGSSSLAAYMWMLGILTRVGRIES